VVARRDALVRQAVERCGRFGRRGDQRRLSLFVSSTARGRCGRRSGRSARSRPKPAHDAAGRVRMGLHTGEPRCAGERYGRPRRAPRRADHRRRRRRAARGLGGDPRAARRTPSSPAGCPRPRPAPAGRPALPRAPVAVGLRGRRPSASIQTFGALRHNLPPQPTTFVGREAADRRGRRLLLGADTRVVNAHRPGWHRQDPAWSLEVARAVLAEFEGGALQASSAPVSDPSL